LNDSFPLVSGLFVLIYGMTTLGGRGCRGVLLTFLFVSSVTVGASRREDDLLVKARGCKHDFDTREFVIGEGGISLVPVDEQAALPALPIESYSRLLSRAPTRVSPGQRNAGTPAKGEQSRMKLDHDVVIPKGFPLKLKKKRSS